MDLLVKTRELLDSLAGATESGSKIARFRIETANLDRKVGLAFRRLGERVFRLETEGRVEMLADADVQSAIEEIRRIRARLEVIRQEAERHRSRARGQFDKAARLVQREAERTAKTIRVETERAADAVKKAVGVKKPPRRSSRPGSPKKPPDQPAG